MKLIGIDTETTNGLTDKDGKLDLSQSLVYDVGWAVVNDKGKVFKTRSYVVAEIFLDKELMSQAFYADKIPTYWEEIKKGERILSPFWKIRKKFFEDAKKYKVEAVFAHNAFFDYTALNNTLRLLSGSKYRWFFPYKLNIWDTLIMSKQVFNRNEKYCEFCNKNGYLTNHKPPQNRMTAEILFRFLSGENGFEESHTGLEDVIIEKEILAECLRCNRKIRKTLFKE